MVENNKNDEKPEIKEEDKKKEEKKEESETKTDAEESKAKFTFKCTRCDKCCLGRGPIPITFWDLELWARNGVVANFLPYMDIYSKPDGGIDLILKPLPPPQKEGEEEKPRDP
ncbi:MAG TPA: hypothetical protein VMV43_06115, partial [Candidatus Nanopelagicaceae bacterium]|nr:hypothetical protein [Candidatus Nanopelagicaceae bacterium]